MILTSIFLAGSWLAAGCGSASNDIFDETGEGTGGNDSNTHSPKKELETQHQALCKRMAGLPCPLANCEKTLAKSAELAVAANCAAEYEATLKCALAKPLRCDTADSDPMAHTDCDPLYTRLSQCENLQSKCSAGQSDGYCVLNCDNPSFLVSCQASQNNSWKCDCSTGPRAGTLFSVNNTDCNSTHWLSQVKAACS